MHRPLLKEESLGEEQNHGDVVDEEQESYESFFLESFNSWIAEHTLISCLLMSVSWLFALAQMITLFELSWQEDLAAYKCLGPSAKFSVVVCGVLVTLIVAMKMQVEERRLCALRLLVKRHTHNDPSTILYCVRALCNPGRATDENYSNTGLNLRVLTASMFCHLRGFAVLTFVYVASIEQLMLFESALQYVINSVILLTLAEVDELLYQCFGKSLLALTRPKAESGSLLSHHRLTAEEQQLNEMFTNLWLLPLTCVSMTVPLTLGKLTGAHCSEQSRFRVSEISMFLLLASRVLCNVALDLRTAVAGSKTLRVASISFLEHAVPAVAYLFLLDLVLVKLLKPVTDDDLFN